LIGPYGGNKGKTGQIAASINENQMLRNTGKFEDHHYEESNDYGNRTIQDRKNKYEFP
jgi:hypothetical protein